MMTCLTRFATALGLFTSSLLLAAPSLADIPLPGRQAFNNVSILIFPPYRDLLELPDNQDSFGRNYVYSLYLPQKPAIEVVVERDGDRRLVVERSLVGERMLRKRQQVISAYKVIGLPSRVFPGLTGLQRIAPETVRQIGVELEPKAIVLVGLDSQLQENGAIAPNLESDLKISVDSGTKFPGPTSWVED